MTFRSLSLLVPTRGHVKDRLERFWWSLADTVTDWRALEVIHRLDDDDPATATFMAGAPSFVRVMSGPRRKGYTSLPTFFNEMASIASGDLLMCGNDDMIFKTRDWPARYLEAANLLPDGRFNLGCYTYPTSAVPFSVVSRWSVNRLGFLNDERLLYSDVFLRDVFARFGRTFLLPQIDVAHIGATDLDAADAKTLVHWEAETYWALHERCVAEAVEKLRAA